MKKHALAAIAGAVVISTLFGCDNKEGMGTELMPAADMADVTIETIEVKAFTDFERPILSSNMSYMMLGEFNDDLFGKTVASCAAKFSNSSYGTYKQGDKCDHLVLTLGVDTTSSFIYGDTVTPVTVEVYRLSEILADSIKYYDGDYDDGSGKYDDSHRIAYDKARPLGSTTFIPYQIDSMITFDIAPWYGDSIIQNSLNTSFDANISGLYFKVSSGNSILRFQRADKNTQFVLYHTRQDAETMSTVTYSIQSTDCSVNMSAHDYSGKPLANIDHENTEYLYLQGMMSTRIRIEFPGLDKIKRGKYFSLRGAYLEIPLADSAYSKQKDFPAIDNIICAGMSRTKRDTLVFFNDFMIMTGTSSTLNVLSRDEQKNCYHLNMTDRVIAMMDFNDRGVEPDFDVCIFPSGRSTDFNRSVICSPSNTKNPMRLVVEYINY